MTRTVRAAAACAVSVLLLGACAKPEPEPIAVSGDELPVAGTVKLQVDAPDDKGVVGPADITYKLEVTSPLQLTMAAAGYSIIPAGDVQHAAGHFHLSWAALDPTEDASKADSVCTPVGETIEAGDTTLDFADGEATTPLPLEPGTYRLCLQLGDGEHTALDPHDEYTIVVLEQGATTTTADTTTTTAVPTTSPTPATTEAPAITTVS